MVCVTLVLLSWGGYLYGTEAAAFVPPPKLLCLKLEEKREKGAGRRRGQMLLLVYHLSLTGKKQTLLSCLCVFKWVALPP